MRKRRRRTRIRLRPQRIGRGLCFAGWALYALSMFLPAISDEDGTLFGWACAWYTIWSVYGLANLLFVLSPAFALSPRSQGIGRRVYVALLALMTVCPVLWIWRDAVGWSIGYYVWASSFALVAAGSLTMLKSDGKRRPATVFAPQPKTREELAAEGELKDFLRS